MAWQRKNSGTLGTLTDDTLSSIHVSGEMPKVFLTGDAHRQPPFQWIESCKKLKQHFQELIRQNQLWVYVEEFQDKIEFGHVPALLHPLIGTQRMVGWEPQVYWHIYKVMKVYGQLLPAIWAGELDGKDSNDLPKLIKRLDEVHLHICLAENLLGTIGRPTELMKATAHEEHLNHYKYCHEASPKSFVQRWTTGWRVPPKPPKPAKLYSKFLKEYHDAGDSLRISEAVQRAIGVGIGKQITSHPGCTHLISCGEDHIVCRQPLQEFIKLPARVNGVVDSDKGSIYAQRRSRIVATGARIDG